MRKSGGPIEFKTRMGTSKLGYINSAEREYPRSKNCSLVNNSVIPINLVITFADSTPPLAVDKDSLIHCPNSLSDVKCLRASAYNSPRCHLYSLA